MKNKIDWILYHLTPILWHIPFLRHFLGMYLATRKANDMIKIVVGLTMLPIDADTKETDND